VTGGGWWPRSPLAWGIDKPDVRFVAVDLAQGSLEPTTPGKRATARSAAVAWIFGAWAGDVPSCAGLHRRPPAAEGPARKRLEAQGSSKALIGFTKGPACRAGGCSCHSAKVGPCPVGNLRRLPGNQERLGTRPCRPESPLGRVPPTPALPRAMWWCLLPRCRHRPLRSLGHSS